jgi:hypothetical protein
MHDQYLLGPAAWKDDTRRRSHSNKTSTSTRQSLSMSLVASSTRNRTLIAKDAKPLQYRAVPARVELRCRALHQTEHVGCAGAVRCCSGCCQYRRISHRFVLNLEATDQLLMLSVRWACTWGRLITRLMYYMTYLYH